MNVDSAIDSFFERNPHLAVSENDEAELKSTSVIQSVDAGTILVPRGANCRYLPFVLQGGIKVHRTAENGREIILYHIQEGESCILSALGIVNETPFPAQAEIEQTGEILLVAANVLKKLIDTYPEWRGFIYSIYNERLGAVLELVDEMLFRRIDIRLSRFLLERTKHAELITDMTHQDIALELGSSREVISRVLKSLQDKKLLSYSRNRIDITNREDLKKIAEL